MSSKKPEAPASVVQRTIPSEFDDAVVWAAWMYYLDELTQSEIAEVIGVSRVTVIKMLQDARSRGIVSIRIDTAIASRAKLSRALIERFNLESAIVVPTIESGSVEQRLGEAAAQVLADHVVAGDVIGVAWGKTVLEAARAISLSSPVSPVTVVQVAGSPTGLSTGFSPELCSSLLANRIGARCVNLLAPAIVSTAKLRDELLAEPAIMKQFAVIRSANRILFGVGELGSDATVRQAELYDGPTIDAFAASGAVAAIMGRFIGHDGRGVSKPIHERMIGISLEELKAIPFRLCVAGGAKKIEAVAAALRGGYATHFVTDQATAEQLIATADHGETIQS